MSRGRAIAQALLLAVLGFGAGVAITFRWIDEVTVDWRVG